MRVDVVLNLKKIWFFSIETINYISISTSQYINFSDPNLFAVYTFIHLRKANAAKNVIVEKLLKVLAPIILAGKTGYKLINK